MFFFQGDNLSSKFKYILKSEDTFQIDGLIFNPSFVNALFSLRIVMNLKKNLDFVLLISGLTSGSATAPGHQSTISQTCVANMQQLTVQTTIEMELIQLGLVGLY